MTIDARQTFQLKSLLNFFTFSILFSIFRCQFLSCTSGRKKNRKNRLRTFPNKWNELSKDQQEDIRRILRKSNKKKRNSNESVFCFLEIPTDTQRCCARCYDKLISHIDDETKKNSNSKERLISQMFNRVFLLDKWTDEEIQKFNEASEKFQDDWTQIAEYVQKSEDDCREFYLRSQRKTDDHVKNKLIEKRNLTSILYVEHR